MRTSCGRLVGRAPSWGVGAFLVVVAASVAGAQRPIMQVAAREAAAVRIGGAEYGLIRGTLRDDSTRAGLADGVVVLLDSLGELSSKAAYSDSTGYFELEVPVGGTFHLVARHTGYVSVMSGLLPVAAGEVVELELPLALGGPPRSHAMILARETIEASDALPAEFARRRAAASVSSIYLVPNAIRRGGFRTAGDIVQRHFAAARSCRAVWLMNGSRSDLAEESLQRLPAAELRAVELHRGGAGLPAELAALGPAASKCGVVGLWGR